MTDLFYIHAETDDGSDRSLLVFETEAIDALRRWADHYDAAYAFDEIPDGDPVVVHAARQWDASIMRVVTPSAGPAVVDWARAMPVSGNLVLLGFQVGGAA